MVTFFLSISLSIYAFYIHKLIMITDKYGVRLVHLPYTRYVLMINFQPRTDDDEKE